MDKDLKNINKKTLAYQTNIDIVLKAMQLAKLKGRKPGESFEPELRELMRANPKEINEIKSKEDLKKMFIDKNILDLREGKDESKDWRKF